ncbi:uncharacterized protein LOC134823619 [Bolinopsis microptera]|uniref:uncharacterized protein LOC134823619 n=1 Tax=Bolinopsis microptera TaxID=2820187 RepID=UPI00307AE07B
MVTGAQSLTCWKCVDANLKSGVKNACSKYSVQQCPVDKDVCGSLVTTFYEGDKFSYMKSYKCMKKADVSSDLAKCRGLKSEFENALDDLKDYACAIETCNYGLCNGLIVPEKPWWKTEPTEAPEPDANYQLIDSDDRQASQSSTPYDHGDAARAIDGNRASSYPQGLKPLVEAIWLNSVVK